MGGWQCHCVLERGDGLDALKPGLQKYAFILYTNGCVKLVGVNAFN